MAKKKSSSSSQKYTKPELRERIKEKLKKSDKGGRPGQWSARKSQMLASEYKKAGGGFSGGKEKPQKSLEKWTDEKWTTADGQKARRGKKKTSRYLPKKAWESMSSGEKKATKTKKEGQSKTGKQYVGNTKKAKASRKKASAASGGATRKKRSSTGRKKAASKKASTKKTSGRKKTTRSTGVRKKAVRKSKAQKKR